MLSPHIHSAPGCVLSQRQRKRVKSGERGSGCTVGAVVVVVVEGGWIVERGKRKAARKQSKDSIMPENDVCNSLIFQILAQLLAPRCVLPY